MNGLAVEHLGAGETLGRRFARLEPRLRREVVERAVEWGVQRGVSDWMEGVRAGRQGMHGLGQDAMSGAIAAAVSNALGPLIADLGPKIMEVVGPAAERASQVVRPQVEAVLKEYGPTFAIGTGIVAAVLGVLGMMAVGGYVVRKVSARPNARRRVA